MRKPLVIIFIKILFCFCSCNSFFMSETYLSIEEMNLIQNDNSVMRFLSKKPISGVLSKEYYLIKAYLPSEMSQLELFSHFRGFDLEDGVRVQFERKAFHLVVKVSIQGYPDKLLLKKENYFLNNNEIDFTVEVENGVSYGFHIQIWENFVNRNGILKHKVGILSNENLLVDSLSEGLIFYTKGQGVKWGLKLSHSNLIEGARISPRVL